MEPEVAVPPEAVPTVAAPESELDPHDYYVKWSRHDFADFFNDMMTNLWNARERLLKKGMANYIGPFLEIYSIVYEACPDNCPLDRELLDRSDAVLTTITGNGPELSGPGLSGLLEDKEDERWSEDEEDEDVKAAKILANAEKLMGIILELNKKSPVKKDAEEA